MPKKHAGGRPTKFDAQVASTIVNAILGGNYMETAAAAAGLQKDTFYAWLRKGKAEPRGPFREFSDAVQKALAESETLDVLRIGRASAENWQASAWRLERRYPDRWGRRERTEHTGPDGGPIKVSFGGRHKPTNGRAE